MVIVFCCFNSHACTTVLLRCLLLSSEPLNQLAYRRPTPTDQTKKQKLPRRKTRQKLISFFSLSSLITCPPTLQFLFKVSFGKPSFWKSATTLTKCRGTQGATSTSFFQAYFEHSLVKQNFQALVQWCFLEKVMHRRLF